MSMNLLGPEPTHLPHTHPDVAVTEALEAGQDPTELAKAHPAGSAAWAALAREALAEGHPVMAYAYARTGYHRGLDSLRKNGWRGTGPVPWAHAPNRGVLTAIAVLSLAAAAINDTEEATRCRQLVADSDPAALAATGL